MGGNDQRPSLGLLVMALAVLRQPLIRDESALVAVAFAATLWSSAALSQAEAETEVAPSQPAVPTAPPAPSRVVPDEPRKICVMFTARRGRGGRTGSLRPCDQRQLSDLTTPANRGAAHAQGRTARQPRSEEA